MSRDSDNPCFKAFRIAMKGKMAKDQINQTFKSTEEIAHERLFFGRSAFVKAFQQRTRRAEPPAVKASCGQRHQREIGYLCEDQSAERGQTNMRPNISTDFRD